MYLPCGGNVRMCTPSRVDRQYLTFCRLGPGDSESAKAVNDACIRRSPEVPGPEGQDCCGEVQQRHHSLRCSLGGS